MTGAARARGRRSARRSLVATAVIAVVALVAVIAIVVIATRSDGPGVSVVDSGGGQEATSTWGMITAGITGDDVPLDVALEAFAYVHQLDIPDVTVPTGAVEGEVPTSGTGVRDWIGWHRDELTAAQRAVIDATAAGPQLGTTLVISPDGDQILPPIGAGFRRLDQPSSSFDSAVSAEAKQLLRKVGVRLGVTMLANGFPDLDALGDDANGFTLDKISVTFSPTAQGFDLMETNPVYDTGNGEESACNITIYPASWTPEANAPTISSDFIVELAHEIVHCYQNIVRPFKLPPWIAEGTATWAATNLFAQSEPITADAFRVGWVGRHRNSVETRTYDAVGFYSLANASGVDVWGNLMKVFADGSTASALQTLQAGAPNVITRWSTHDFRRPGWGAEWQIDGIGVPDDATPVIQSPTIGRGGKFSDSREQNSVEMYSFSVDDDVVTFVSTAGTMSVHDEAGTGIEGFNAANFCMLASCVCPSGTPRAGEDIASVKLSQPFALGLAGGSDGTGMTGVAMDLKTACGAPTTIPPNVPGTPPPPCGSKCARSNGDPHLTTVTGAPYDFQAAGEYVLLRAPDDAFEVQVRQQPFEDSDHVAINTAVAVASGRHRVQAEVAAGGATVTVTADGMSFDVTGSVDAAVELGDGVTISRTDRGMSIGLADGTVVYLITSNPTYGIQVNIAPSAAVAAGGVGLLGVVDRLATYALPALPDGSAPTGATERDAIYDSLGPAWMVTADDSVFTYADGASPASFVLDGFPVLSTLRTPADLTDEEIAAAAPACGSFEDAASREACAFDVTVTGDAGFSAPYTVIDDLVTLGAASLDDPVPSGGGNDDGDGGAPAIAGLVDVIDDAFSVGGVALDGDRAFLTVQLADDSSELVVLDLSSGTVTTTTPIPVARRLVVAAGSVWVDETEGDACAVTRRDVDDLSVVATIHPDTCFVGVDMAQGGDQLWVLGYTPDSTGVSVPSAIPVDPATNAFGTGVPLPDDADSFVIGGEAGIVVRDSAAVLIPAGSTDVVRLRDGISGTAVGGDGVWVEDDDGISLLAVDGSVLADFPGVTGLQGAAGSSAFAATTANDGSEVLVRLSADGSKSIAAEPPPDELPDGSTLSFFTDRPFGADDAWAVQIWVIPDGTTQSIRASIIPLG